MWWHGGAGLTERSERGSLSAVATHDLFCLLGSSSFVSVGPLLVLVSLICLVNAANDDESNPGPKETGDAGKLLPEGQVVLVGSERHPNRHDDQ